jgi:hypothetical protein
VIGMDYDLKPETYNGNFITFKKNFWKGVQGTAYKGGKIQASVSGNDKAEVLKKIKMVLK